MTASDKLLNALAAEVISAELEPLGLFLDRVEARLTKATPQDRAALFLTTAKRARNLIERGVDLPGVRSQCTKSTCLFSLLEAVLFERANTRGRLNLGIDWSGYGK